MYNSTRLVTGKYAEVAKISLVQYEYGGYGRVMDVSEPDEKLLFDALKSTGTRLRLYPGHSQSMQHDPKFGIDVQYQDGGVERLIATENRKYFFRYTGTHSSGGDLGYVLSRENEDIFAIIERYFHEHTGNLEASRF